MARRVRGRASWRRPPLPNGRSRRYRGLPSGCTGRWAAACAVGLPPGRRNPDRRPRDRRPPARVVAHAAIPAHANGFRRRLPRRARGGVADHHRLHYGPPRIPRVPPTTWAPVRVASPGGELASLIIERRSRPAARVVGFLAVMNTD